MRKKLNETLSAKTGLQGLQKYGGLEAKLFLKGEVIHSQLNIKWKASDGVHLEVLYRQYPALQL